MGFANSNVRFLCLTAALVLVVATALLWPAPRAPYFEGPEMAFQRDVPRTFYLRCNPPGGTSRFQFTVFPVSCSNLETSLRKVFNPADAVSDAKWDLERGAFRFIGRSAGRRSEAVIPGIEHASDNLRNALYDSACVVRLRAPCKSFPSFDSYAKAYNATALIKPAGTSSSCR